MNTISSLFDYLCQREIMLLREYLDKKLITYREFAEKLGIHLQSAKNIAYGKRQPSLGLALKIETLTGGKVKVKELVKNLKDPSEIKQKRKFVGKRLKISQKAEAEPKN